MSPEPAAIRRLRALLDEAGADYTLYRHDHNVASAEDGVRQGFGNLHDMAPTLILKCEEEYVAAVIGGDRRIAYKQVKKRLGLKNVSLAGPGQVREATGAGIGWVSLVNPGLKTLVDERLLQTGTACGGCGASGYSLRIAAADLVRITGAEVFDFTTPKEKDSPV